MHWVSAEDRSWLTVMIIATVVELSCWAMSWHAGIAPAPFVLTYVLLALAALGCAMALRWLLDRRAPNPNWFAVVPATFCVGVGASVFLPLKYAIPHLVPFWLDGPLVEFERSMFAGDPWMLLDQLLGWAVVPLDKLYGLWLPTQALVLFTIMLQPPSLAKSRALIAYVLTWLLLGVVAAMVFSSAGPIFHDRVFGGRTFAPLRATLLSRGASIALAESDRMWASLASARPGIVAGISAVPSIHVAISVWFILAARSLAPGAAKYGALYALVIWIGSVQLGWHYVTDGLAGALGAWAIWALSRPLLASLSGWSSVRSRLQEAQLA